MATKVIVRLRALPFMERLQGGTITDAVFAIQQRDAETWEMAAQMAEMHECTDRCEYGEHCIDMIAAELRERATHA